MRHFEGWTPARVYWKQDKPVVDWCHLGQLRLVDPFFEQTIMQAIRHPANLLFRHQTPIEALGELAESRPGLIPKGFVFHMSRCGSTLISQMLAALPKNVVISEASPIDAILRGSSRNNGITEGQRVQWFLWMVNALGQRRHPEEEHLFIKFDCWHALFLPLIERAFPGVPWIFVYRQPVEVLMSQSRQRGSQVIPGVLQPSLFGWDAQVVQGMTLEEYASRVLAKICEAALERARSGTGRLLNYRQLPGLIWPVLMNYWGVPCLSEEVDRMRSASRFNAKNPALPFENDAMSERRSAPEEIREASRLWLEDVYQRLETQRLKQGFA